MEYITYILVILAITGVGVLMVRLPGRNRLKNDKVALSSRSREHRSKIKPSRAELQKQKTHNREVIDRELSKVPVPWGWPGHDGHLHADDANLDEEGYHGLSYTLHHFVDKMTSEKKTVQDKEYMQKRSASLRSMVEDRFGQAKVMPEVKYRKTKAPRLRDPSEPHDQMDNFPAGKADRIESGLGNIAGATNLYGEESRKKRVNLKDVKKPWGW